MNSDKNAPRIPKNGDVSISATPSIALLNRRLGNLA